ncbi:hypothetical protein [Desulfobacula phenolica]|uniref:Uncharacterized protein n=1 Tax=Desulfobacula phenolica TaxID=90732 RepID=A0A1H2DSE9_9BACT|nr:hypothetical protein [Desulfobacula phenolica]SDT85777.1 hypothetical protein SAMN04487931_10288 [Desulfobacula phenolica]
MTEEKSDNDTQKPIIDYEATADLTDYFCPFCNHKLFRGKVTEFNMVCSNCNKLVRSSNIPAKETNPEKSDSKDSNQE